MIVPKSRPQWIRNRVSDHLTKAGVTDAVALLGVRGYYRDSMGAVGRNDRGIYDDSIFLISPTTFASFNANVDPSVARPGIAVLQPGLWRYKVGIHGLSKPRPRRYKALVQAAPVVVRRDGRNNNEKPSYLGINIHKGSIDSTSSLGCQTIHPSQWSAFIALVAAELKRHGQQVVPYLLMEGQG